MDDVKVGDVVQMVEIGIGSDRDIGLVIKTELRRQHLYLDKEQYVDVLRSFGKIETVFSDYLRVLQSKDSK